MFDPAHQHDLRGSSLSTTFSIEIEVVAKNCLHTKKITKLKIAVGFPERIKIPLDLFERSSGFE